MATFRGHLFCANTPEPCVEFAVLRSDPRPDRLLLAAFRTRSIFSPLFLTTPLLFSYRRYGANPDSMVTAEADATFRSLCGVRILKERMLAHESETLVVRVPAGFFGPWPDCLAQTGFADDVQRRMPIADFLRATDDVGTPYVLCGAVVPVFVNSENHSSPTHCMRESGTERVGWPGCIEVDRADRLRSVGGTLYLDRFSDCDKPDPVRPVLRGRDRDPVHRRTKNRERYLAHYGVTTADASTDISGTGPAGEPTDIVLDVDVESVPPSLATGSLFVPVGPRDSDDDAGDDNADGDPDHSFVRPQDRLNGHLSTGSLKSIERAVGIGLSSHRLGGVPYESTDTYMRLATARCLDHAPAIRGVLLEGVRQMYLRYSDR